MENHSPGSVASSAARDQLGDAQRAHDGSARRALVPAEFILALSVFCGAQTMVPAYKGPGNAVSIIAVAWFLAELLRMSARNGWRALPSWPKPRWAGGEVMLISVAVLVGGVVGPHLLASHANSILGSWGLGTAVTVIVAACLFAAKASYQRRASRMWQR